MREYAAHRLEALRVAVQTQVSRSVAESVMVDRSEDYVTHDMIWQLRAAVLAEKLPPQTITARFDYRHPEAVGGYGCQDDPRWETWWDHFLATYRGRWFVRWFREPRTIMTPVRYRVTMPVTCQHEATVDVLGYWTYPRANTSLPGFGHPVFVVPGPVEAVMRPVFDA